MSDHDEWRLSFAEEFDAPGWLQLPRGLAPKDHGQWIATALSWLSALMHEAGSPMDEPAVPEFRRILRAGLEERARSRSFVIYLVFPVATPAAVLCHLNVMASEALPPWSALDGVVHSAEAPHIGPGVQFSSGHRVYAGGRPTELCAVHFAFDDGEVALLMSLEESVPVLISRALPGFVQLKDALRMERRDGGRFTSVPPEGVLEEAPWRLEQPEDVR